MENIKILTEEELQELEDFENFLNGITDAQVMCELYKEDLKNNY